MLRFFCSATLITIGLSFSSILSASANPINGKISQIVDGDTVIVNNNTKLQLACIDSPDWINGQPQPHAETSKRRLTQLLPIGSSIRYYRVGTVSGNRVLAVILKGNTNINLQMVTEGQSKLHPNYRNSCPSSATALSNAQTNAQNRRLGIWNR
jgi:endonuclease YncB( thermonuclease family)